MLFRVILADDQLIFTILKIHQVQTHYSSNRPMATETPTTRSKTLERNSITLQFPVLRKGSCLNPDVRSRTCSRNSPDFRERWRTLLEETQEKLQIIYDGMATDATDRYHAYTSPAYINESVMNYVENAADFEPFVPEIAQRPSHARDRRELLTSDTAPIIVCPSGCLLEAYHLHISLNWLRTTTRPVSSLLVIKHLVRPVTIFSKQKVI